uniref:Uncharacterized protein n=1 Tax=Romanomermis culicivorax TaxID=13658 RepID=A0A915K5D4_ROMCU
MDTFNCICEDTSNALLIPCNSRESPNDKPFYHQNCDNVSTIYFKKMRKPTPYWECSVCFKITQF